MKLPDYEEKFAWFLWETWQLSLRNQATFSFQPFQVLWRKFWADMKNIYIFHILYLNRTARINSANGYAVIYTQQISRQFKLDIDRHNAQYAPIDVETFRLSHDRFLCIDNDVYHIGASIKDLGKKWFGFSKMEILTPDELVERINRG